MSKKLIIFGPWCGEFSYELSWWNPECRKIRNDNFKDYYSIHLGFNGRSVAYKDFIDEYISHPLELEETLQFPATYGEHINGQDIIPSNFMEHLNKVVLEFKERGFTEIVIHKPKDIPITRQRCLDDHPFGEYIHYEVDKNIEADVVSKINNYFNNDNPTVFLMARTRTRHGNICYLDWNSDNWPIFTERLINELGVNIISLSISIQGSRGGSIGLASHPKLEYLKDKIMDFELLKDDKDSFEKQLAILKNTKCSIYGASGAAVVPFFVNTPTFTQQTLEEGFRLTLGWEKDLTDNLKNVKIFDKYKNGEIYDSPADELFEEFKQFYMEI
tara:strand:+ start:277 stop:1266 length:990 start_codon:yes stop_codon:yes gene_type:complete